MVDHEIEIHRYTPAGKNNYHYIAICSCHRWRSNPYRDREDAETKGLTHVARGDEHLRALAAQDRGASSLLSQYKWYTEMAEDPFTTPEQQEMWRRLADELRPRVQPRNFKNDSPLF